MIPGACSVPLLWTLWIPHLAAADPTSVVDPGLATYSPHNPQPSESLPLTTCETDSGTITSYDQNTNQ